MDPDHATAVGPAGHPPLPLVGLTARVAAARLEADGPNRLPAPPRVHPWRRLAAQLTHFFARLLWAAGALAFIAGMPQLGIAVFVVVLVNAAFAYVQEQRAEQAAARLRELLPAGVIVRRDGPKPRVLMGKRHGGHDFMANLWVFPGGRIDKADYRAPFATDLRPEVAGKFHTHVSPGKARALGLAAIRETFEEAGLLLAQPVEPRPAAGPWREFLAEGAAADLEALSIVYRAVTPPMLAKRFDTWFLMADAERLISLERRPDCGELEEIAWFEFEEALDLKLPMVTRGVITEVMARNRPVAKK